MNKLHQLLFVYNANSSVASGLMDMFHKVLSPRTYPCSLCAVTYGTTAMRPAWKQFIQSLPAETRFLHRDELAAQFPQLRGQPLPAAFRQAGDGTWQVFLSKDELDRTDLPALMQLVSERLRTDV